MTTFIPIFPLKLVTYPNEKVNLHIFEERYQQLINECFDEQKTFGMPVFMNNKIMDFGTELELVAIRKTYPDGRMDISCKGIRTFKIEEIYNPIPDKLYAGADVFLNKNQAKGDLLKNLEIIERLGELYQLLKINRPVPQDSSNLRMFDIGHHIGLSINQEYQLLTLDTEIERQDMVLNHVINMIPMIEEMERLRERVKLNGHFKNIIPPNF
ncbi:MAG: LON peptidase substrate-binding domain-containing protein [Saprospiraceae bacterium]